MESNKKKSRKGGFCGKLQFCSKTDKTREGGWRRRKKKLSKRRKILKLKITSVRKIVRIHFCYVLIRGLISSLIISTREKKNILLIFFRLRFLISFSVIFLLLSLSHNSILFKFIYSLFSFIFLGYRKV